MTTETTTYYHVAGPHYREGDDLLCWDRLIEQGAVAAEDWKWPDADCGLDSDVVCLFERREDAVEFVAEYGGTLLTIEIPDDAHELGMRMTTVGEGYPAVFGAIPAELIRI